ncbi:hypothetical protein K458DRAFT_441739 [Lentithecium fluviatile CBS 122367]|uniref:Nicotinamide N-methyltransferase n=1 Tax=Lentithecium fluviatile CBS 122367 TaxID=1168545 RepID=A0A6G1J6F6_9PLEO|nr:hypothetical protein K458DRAFT_441739 [Lentithecium fluviatile CBS 122367]
MPPMKDWKRVLPRRVPTTSDRILTDNPVNQHQHGGDASTVLHYRPSNKRFPEVQLRTADVHDEERWKFAHYLWNAGVLMGEVVAGREDGEWWLSPSEEEHWRVKGEKVLELGAGVGLGGIMSALAGAQEIAITDYPVPTILATISTNVSTNLPLALQYKTSIHPHQWGVFTTPFATTHFHQYTRILAADCLWVPYEHGNLARSMLHFLSEAPGARVYVIAGFHTGRATVARFFEETAPEVGLEIVDIFEMNSEGARREWLKERDAGEEDIGEWKKWLAVARLRRRGAE